MKGDYRGRLTEKMLKEVEDYGAENRIPHGDGWVYGNLIKDGGRRYIVGGVEECNEEYIAISWWTPVEPITVGQYAGAKDKNGKEMYEGDVAVQRFIREDIYDVSTDTTSLEGYHVGVVVLSASKGICLKNSMRHLECDGEIVEEWQQTKNLKPIIQSRCEVIGNIHDNPNIIEEWYRDSLHDRGRDNPAL